MYNNKEFLKSLVIANGIAVESGIVKAYDVNMDLSRLIRPLMNLDNTRFVRYFLVKFVEELCEDEGLLGVLIDIIGMYGLQDVFARKLYKDVSSVDGLFDTYLSIYSLSLAVCRNMLVGCGNIQLTNGIEIFSNVLESRVMYDGKTVSNLSNVAVRLDLNLTCRHVYLRHWTGDEWIKIGCAPYNINANSYFLEVIAHI